MTVNRRALVIGASGLVGKAVYEAFQSDQDWLVWGTYKRRKANNLLFADITDLASLRKVFSKIKPNVVVLSAALTNVDYCEDCQEEAYQINVAGTQNVAQLCQEYQAKIVYFSTDYVFDGENGPYRETDKTNPVSFYGRTKLEGERGVGELLDDYLIIRTTGIYGWDRESKNFIMQLIGVLSQGRTMRVPNDQYGNPTLASNLAEVTKELVARDEKGIFNIVGPDYLNRYEFSFKAADILGLDKNLIEPVSTPRLKQKARRPLKGGLTITKAQSKLKTRLLGVEEGISKVKAKMEGHIDAG